MNIGERPGKRRKRAVACNRCHKHKIKCSGEHPCQSCQQANAAAECEFPNRDRQVTVQESYIQKLEAQVRELKAQVEVERCSSLPSLAEGRNSAVDQVAEANAAADADLPNLLLELRHGKSPNHALPFAGEASCTAFSDRLLHCIDRNQDTVSHSALPDHISGPMFNRLMSSNYQLPDRVRASLLIRRVDRFIGNNYQLFLKKSFFRKFDETYASNNFSDVLWGCHLFALLALGELYSCYHAEPTNGKDVPGTAYFLQAITLLQDDYEHPSIEQIQVLLLLSFYANCIGRLQSAHVYCGIALRSSISLGLHRSRSTTTGLSRKDQEHRRRIWWTLYLFDRLISSKLGFPLGIRDGDIDVEMPSSESLTSEDQQEFHDPKHLCAHVKLSRITGSILTDVYCLPNHGTTTFVRRVHRVLNQLRKWDSELPSELRIQADNSARNLYTLHMHYHLCIIQTTRPILFHIFTTELQSSNATPSHSFSPTTLALADACKQSAMSTNHLLSRLFIDGNLAVFGYFDSHYIFSSTLILIIAGTMEPAAKLSEAVQMAFSLLGTMASNGNVSAKDYLRRLGKIQSSIITSRDASLTANASAMPSRVSPGITSEAATSRVPHAYQNESEHNWPLPSSYFQDDAVQPSDPLGNPFIEDFLAEKAFEWPSGPSPQQDIFRQFTHELGDELIFGF